VSFEEVGVTISAQEYLRLLDQEKLLPEAYRRGAADMLSQVVLLCEQDLEKLRKGQKEDPYDPACAAAAWALSSLLERVRALANELR